MRDSMSLELTLAGLLLMFANHYTTQDTLLTSHVRYKNKTYTK